MANKDLEISKPLTTLMDRFSNAYPGIGIEQKDQFLSSKEVCVTVTAFASNGTPIRSATGCYEAEPKDKKNLQEKHEQALYRAYYRLGKVLKDVDLTGFNQAITMAVPVTPESNMPEGRQGTGAALPEGKECGTLATQDEIDALVMSEKEELSNNCLNEDIDYETISLKGSILFKLTAEGLKNHNTGTLKMLGFDQTRSGKPCKIIYQAPGGEHDTASS